MLRAPADRRSPSDYWIGALERFGLLPNYTLARRFGPPRRRGVVDRPRHLGVARRHLRLRARCGRGDPRARARIVLLRAGSRDPGRRRRPRARRRGRRGLDLLPGVRVRPSHSRRRSSSSAPGAGADGHRRCRPADAGRRARRRCRRSHGATRPRSATAATTGRRTAFTVQVAADLDPAGIVRRWYDKETGFGVTYARDLTIRWINLGKRTASGATRLHRRRGGRRRRCSACATRAVSSTRRRAATTVATTARGARDAIRPPSAP